MLRNRGKHNTLLRPLRLIFIPVSSIFLAVPLGLAQGETDEMPSDVSVEDLLDLGFHAPLCDYALLHKGDRSAGLCDAEIIDGICSQEASSYQEAIESLLSAKEIGTVSQDPIILSELRSGLNQEFRDAISDCVQSGVVIQEEKVSALESDPARQARIAAGKSRFWHLKLRVLGRAIANPALAKVAGKPVIKSLNKAIFAGLCKAGVATYTSLAKPVVGYDHEDACVESENKIHARKTACINLAGSACSAIGGFVDLNKWPGFTDANEGAKTALDILSIGAEGLCRYNGASPVCGLVNVAAEQLAMSLETGNNDVIECTGIRQSMQCIGQTIGQDGWSNKSGIAEARRVKDRRRHPDSPDFFWVKPCCFCQKEAYQSRWLRSDLLVWKKTHLSVIQGGSFEGGNCAWLEGRNQENNLKPRSYDYITYRNCKRVELINNACTTEGHENMYIWLDEHKQAGGIVPIRH